MKEGIIRCTGTTTVAADAGGGCGGLGVLSKGYPNGKKCNIKEQPPLLCNQSRCEDGGGGGGDVSCAADVDDDRDDGKRPTFIKEIDTDLINTCHFAVADSTTISVPVPVVLSTAHVDDGVVGASGVRSPPVTFYDTCYPTYNFLRSPGGVGMAATLAFFPFTAAQWKELQRQAMIYKYMVACVPVPHDLLFPLDTSSSASSWGKMGMLSVRWAGNGKDAEPGRCKRTDGKKWRCSKDVVPNQKYCERHLNRGRPRSRKPVESHAGFSINSTKNSAKKTRLGDPHNSSFNPLSLKSVANGSSSALRGGVGVGCPVQGFDGNQESSGSPFAPVVVPAVPLPAVEARNLKWPMEMGNAGIFAAADGSFYNPDSSVFQHQLSSETGNSSLFLDFNSNKANLQSCSPAKGFLDAWSSHGLPNNDDRQGSSVASSDGKISPSSLALSMGRSNAIDEEMCSMGMGYDTVIDSSSGNHGEGSKDHMSSWISPSTWLPSDSNPGGPLAEALQPRPVSTADAASEAILPSAGNGDLTTPPSTTTVSSPSGVLQRALASFSDSSGSTSPICEDRKSTSLIPLHWLA